MSERFLSFGFLLIIFLGGCNKEQNASTSGREYPDALTSGEIGLSSPGGGAVGNNPGNAAIPEGEYRPGVITAGEWNDLNNWAFWQSIIKESDYKAMPGYWSFFNDNRIVVEVSDLDSGPARNILVKLKSGSRTLFSARTDNKGRAELWLNLFHKDSKSNLSDLKIDIGNGTKTISNIKAYDQGINKITIPASQADQKIEISFVVDATGSMGDELEYLKTELLDVIARVQSTNFNASVSTSSVFYRDEGDEYVTKFSPFTNNPNVTISFIKEQRAEGGGDFPEAVHKALDVAVNRLQWSSDAKTRILFLVLDAPPHYENGIISSIQQSIVKASEKGIKIIPVTASGIDKETEFLMRFLAISTNGTYVFITNDSGIGNDHLQPTVGEYQVEFLNDLVVRLINKYAE